MGSANCTECGAIFTFDVVPRRGKICFKCHVGGIRFGFTNTREMFHGMTSQERRNEIEAHAKRDGRQIERLPEKVWI